MQPSNKIVSALPRSPVIFFPLPEDVLGVDLKPYHTGAEGTHSGKPALRRPSAKRAKCSGLRSGLMFLRLESRSVGSSSRRRAIALPARSVSPIMAQLAAKMRIEGL